MHTCHHRGDAEAVERVDVLHVQVERGDYEIRHFLPDGPRVGHE